VLQPVLLDLDQVVAEAGDLLRRLVHESIDLAIAPAAEQLKVVADPAQVERVLLNLTVNARDAMPEGGTLTISTGVVDVAGEVAAEHEVSQGPYAAITVADTGEGMDAETKARIFEPFFTTKGAAEGNGLGLATVYGIVRQSEGFVRVESSPGAGATFQVCFPLAVGRDEPRVAAKEPDPAVTVLLAEDEAIVRELAATALEQAGYGVVPATGGLEALAYCESADAPVDVLLTDMVMPGMGGRELAERLVAERPGTPVVLMSGYTAEPPALRVDGGSRVTFLQKPFTPRALAQAVSDALQRPAANGNGRHAPRPGAVTCLVADDHPAMLDSISGFLEREGFSIVMRASRADEALEGIEKLKPAIALLDVSMQPLSGIEVAHRASQTAPATRIVLYTGYHDSALLEQALDAGARGFVLKEAPLSELARALRVVANDGTYVDSDLSATLASARAVGRVSPLTKREQEILRHLADGMTNDRAASALGISAETVQSHVRNAMTKLDADTRTEAVATALRQSLIR
jgi:DNA-binding NarL/FixJ family response regulator